jgi:predicted dehydrogenase
MTLKTQRIAPGEKDTWYLEVLGTRASARFSTKNPKRLELLTYNGGEQVWGQIDMGHETAFKSLTGPIFEFGFSDAILQMWASFLHELVHGRPVSRFAGCVTPEETALSHRLFTAALQSHAESSVVAVQPALRHQTESLDGGRLGA